MAQLILPQADSRHCNGVAEPRRCVYVIDDDIAIRKSLHFLLSASAITTWPFAEASDFLDQLGDLEPAPILLDILMPKIGGLEMLKLLNARNVQWPVIMMTAHGDVPVAVSAMKLGAIEFLEKPFQPETLDIALNHAFDVIDRVTRVQRARDDARHRISLLSRRETEVVTILTEGIANKEAASRLGLSARTVEMHRGNAMAKLGLRSIAEAVALMATAELQPHRAGQASYHG